MGFMIEKVNVEVLLVYLEFLVSNKFSPSHIANDLAGIKAHFVYYSLPICIFDDLKIKYFIRSLRLNAPHNSQFISY